MNLENRGGLEANTVYFRNTFVRKFLDKHELHPDPLETDFNGDCSIQAINIILKQRDIAEMLKAMGINLPTKEILDTYSNRTRQQVNGAIQRHFKPGYEGDGSKHAKYLSLYTESINAVATPLQAEYPDGLYPHEPGMSGADRVVVGGKAWLEGFNSTEKKTFTDTVWLNFAAIQLGAIIVMLNPWARYRKTGSDRTTDSTGDYKVFPEILPGTEFGTAESMEPFWMGGNGDVSKHVVYMIYYPGESNERGHFRGALTKDAAETYLSGSPPPGIPGWLAHIVQGGDPANLPPVEIPEAYFPARLVTHLWYSANFVSCVNILF
jgi:hypothetical protein